MARWLTLIVGIGAGVAIARAAVYGSGAAPSASPLQGWFLLSAFTGGVALAFSGPFLLVLLPFLTVLSSEKASAGPLAPVVFLGGFALAFIVTISGFPGFIATPIYQSRRVIDPAGGVFFLIWGLLSFLGFLPAGSLQSRSSIRGRLFTLTFPALLGLTTGVLMYHELDPTYDSVFFATANAVAASHAPFTVASFTAGLGLIYLAASSLAAAARSRAPWDGRVRLGGRMLSGIATAVIGVLILAHRFDAVRGLLF